MKKLILLIAFLLCLSMNAQATYQIWENDVEDWSEEYVYLDIDESDNTIILFFEVTDAPL